MQVAHPLEKNVDDIVTYFPGLINFVREKYLSHPTS